MASIKHKENGEWVKIGEAPLSTPIDITRYVPIPLPDDIEPGDTPVYIDSSVFNAIEDATSGNYQNTGISIQVTKAGTYRFRWGFNDSGGASSRLYKNNQAIGSEHQGSSVSSYSAEQEDVVCEANDTVTLWLKPYVYRYSGSDYYYGGAGGLTASISWPELEALLQ